MSLDPTSPASIAIADFETTRRGFDPAAVRVFLQAVSMEMSKRKDHEAALAAEVASLRDELATLRQNSVARSAVDLDEATVASLLGEEAARVLTTAREGAAQVRARAEREAEADRQALAEAIATERAAAEAEAARLRHDASTAAERVRREASEQAAAEVETAKIQGRDMVFEARAYREKVMADLQRRRESAQVQLDALNLQRARLRSSFEGVRTVLDEIRAELHDGELGPSPLDDLPAISGAFPTIARYSEPSMSTSVAAEPQPESSYQAPVLSVVAPIIEPVEEPVEDTVGEAATDAVDDTVDDAADDAVDDVVEEPAAVEEMVVVEETVVVVEETIVVVDDEMVVVEETVVVLEETLEPEDTLEPEAAEVEAVEPETAEVEAVEPEAAEVVDAVEEETAPAEPRERLAVVHDLVRVRKPVETKPADGRTKVDDVFAKLRAARVDDGAPADEPAPVGPMAAVDMPTAGGVLVAERVEIKVVLPEESEVATDQAAPMVTQSLASASDVIAARELVLSPIAESLARRLKRVLADEQSEVLDLLRRKTRKTTLTVEDLFPAADEHRGRYATAAAADVEAAAISGASAVSAGETAALSSMVGKVGIVGLVTDSLLDTLVTPLRARLERAYLDAGDDTESAADQVRAIYREWKTSRIDAASGQAATNAYGRGSLAALTGEDRICWVVDPNHPCAEGDDNVLAGAVAAGEEFPTGHRFAPAYAGCRCAIALASR